ncbi:Chaperone required for the assembly of the mitochondrial F1-ATPase [Paramagnetospirillum magnetotacticum MS-1]|uniref:Chaperone required for the assembly of the mitochondrial F1-ATPase n=1 Tax=Paramagnetospirillum magnetotacticum MS-1 TaxID=272627 RepID=A0A0C2V4P9_PARME|nr:ATP12 family protein [Paramagnetospirillum magnetotacticum]KIM00057.1 Chaperone required for the assembly of the mitochondrial F1-ATPase [Paramagnetospirillum magnetotacticum MS-1]
MSFKSIKRFYKDSSAEPRDGGYAIFLDGKAIKTPGGRPLSVPSARLADAIAGEWREQGEQILPSTMPLTQLASTALDRVGPERPHITAQLMNYAGTDLLCYRADCPADLVARQSAAWQPLLDWAAQSLDAPLATTTSLTAVAQSPSSLTALQRHIETLDLWRLTSLQSATAAMGSLILGLGLIEGRLDAEAAFQASQLDETYQIELWGEDWEAADRRAELKADIEAAARFLSLLKPS